MFKKAEKIKEGVVIIGISSEHDKSITQLVCTNNNDSFNEVGNLLRTSAKTLKWFYVEKKRTPKYVSRFSIDRFKPIYEKHADKVEDSLTFSLLSYLLDTLYENTNHSKGNMVMDFYMMIHSFCPEAFHVVSANLNDPSLKNLHKHTKRAESKHNSLGCIIDRHHDKLLCTQVIIDNHKAIFSKNFPVAYSVSGDGTKTVEVISELSRYGEIVGGAHTNYPLLTIQRNEFEKHHQ